MLYCFLDMVRDRYKCYFLFWALFCFYPANRPKNQNEKKMKKAPGDIIILNMSTKNYDKMMYSS